MRARERGCLIADGRPERRFLRASEDCDSLGHPRLVVTERYTPLMSRENVTLSFDEAMAICLLFAEAADATSADEELRDTWAGEARLMIEMILGRTDE